MRTKIWLANVKGADRLGDVGLNEKLILNFIAEKQVVRSWPELIWFMKGPVAGFHK